MADGIAVLRLLRQPAGISVMVVAVLAIVIWADQARKRPDSDSADNDSATSLSSSHPSAESAPVLGGELPAIVKRYGGASQESNKAVAKSDKSPAPGLENLLAGLESKVKSDPTNIGNRLLLAQTYLELGLREKALIEARDIAEKNPSLSRPHLVLASILSTSQQETELKEAIALLDGLRTNTDVKQFLVRLYLGDASIRLGDHPGAINNWKAALETMPVTDNRREELQKRITELDRNA